MKTIYRIRVQPGAYQVFARSLGSLTEEALTKAIDGVVVREAVSGNRGDTFLNLQLQRQTHEQALNEILVALQQLGYSWLEASVTEYVDNALGGLLVGGGAMGTAGFSTGDSSFGLMLTVLGALVGIVVGSLIESKKVVYEVTWTGFGWQLVQVHPAPASRVGIGGQPRLA